MQQQKEEDQGTERTQTMKKMRGGMGGYQRKCEQEGPSKCYFGRVLPVSLNCYSDVTPSVQERECHTQQLEGVQRMWGG